MEKIQKVTLHTLLLLLPISASLTNEDKHQSQDLRLSIQKASAKVALIPGQGLRRQRDVGQDNPYGCYPDEYYSDYYRKCRGCTRCSPGTQHDPQEPCGNGQGEEAHCTRCEDGYYQPHHGIAVLTCQPCSLCDPHAIILQPCSQRSNTVCGKCQKGWHYNGTDICVECTGEDLTNPANQDCYVEPEPTPGPKSTHLGPQSGPGPDLDLSTKASVRSKEPDPKPTTGKAVNKNPNELISRKMAVIIGTLAAFVILIILIIVGLIKYTPKIQKYMKRKVNKHPAVDECEMEALEKHNHEKPGKQDPIPQPDLASRQDLLPPSSQQNSSRDSVSGPPCDTLADFTPSQDGPPTLNNVTADGVHCDAEHAVPPEVGPMSVPHSLKSYEPQNYRPLEGAQYPSKVNGPHSQVTCREENETAGNYDVAPEESIQSAIGSLSSHPRDNIQRAPNGRL